jgi:hypothetical protein
MRMKRVPKGKPKRNSQADKPYPGVPEVYQKGLHTEHKSDRQITREKHGG